MQFFFFCQFSPFYLFLSLALTLTFSLLVSFFPISPRQLWYTLWYRHHFFADHITGCSLFPPLHTALSCWSQFAAGGWDMHTHENRTTCRGLGCMHTALVLTHTCTQSWLWSSMLEEIMNCCLRWVLNNYLALCICRFCNSCRMYLVIKFGVKVFSGVRLTGPFMVGHEVSCSAVKAFCSSSLVTIN